MKLCPACGKKCADVSKKCIYCDNVFEEAIVENSASDYEGGEKNDSLFEESISELKKSDNVDAESMKNAQIDGDLKDLNKLVCDEENDRDSRQNSGAYSFSDSLPEGFTMTEEEVNSLLFGEEHYSNDFGSAVPTIDSDELLINACGSPKISFAGLFGIASIILGMVALFDFFPAFLRNFSEMFPLLKILETLFAVKISESMRMIAVGALALPQVIISVASVALFFSANSNKNLGCISASLKAVRIGLTLACVTALASIAALDIVGIVGRYVQSDDKSQMTAFIAVNCIALAAILYFAFCYASCRNCSDVISVAEKIKSPCIFIDVVNFVLLISLVVGVMEFIVKKDLAAFGVWNDLIIFAWSIFSFAAVLMFEISTISFRRGVNSVLRISDSVERNRSETIKYK